MSYFSDPVKNAESVTPSDTTTFTSITHGIYVGGAGDLAVTTVKGNVVTFKSVPVGLIIPVQASKVMATNTTATDIVRMW